MIPASLIFFFSIDRLVTPPTIKIKITPKVARSVLWKSKNEIYTASSLLHLTCGHTDFNWSSVADETQPNCKWSVVYHPKYNVRFCGLEKFHPFDSLKWGNVVEHLKKNSFLKDDSSYYIPEEASYEDLLKVHTRGYLRSLDWSIKVAAIAEIPLVALVPNALVQKWYLRAMRFQVGGSVLAGKLAMQKGWAINIGGGFHHCSRKKGGGFCPYADISLLIHELVENHPSVKRVMIVDLDAHQGNGHEYDFGNDDNVFILDVFNNYIYPRDDKAKTYINCCVEIPPFTGDDEYLHLVESYLEKSLSKFHPDIIVYNAGTDILDGDPLGRLAISPRGIINRDKIVFMKARERRIPIVMLTSGGYLRCTAKIIADSISNLADLELISPC